MCLRALFVLLILLVAGEALAVTRWVSAPARCANNGNGATNACAASPGAAGSYDGIANLNFTGLGGGDTINFFCNGNTDNFSGKVTISVSGTAGNPLVIQSDPASCGTPTAGLTATHYSLVGNNIEFDTAGNDYITFRNINMAPAGAHTTANRGLVSVTGVGNGIIIEHMRIDKSAASVADDADLAGVYLSFGSGVQGNTANDDVIVRYTEILDNNSNPGEGVGIRFVKGTGAGAIQRVQVYQNYIHNVYAQCIFMGTNGSNNTYNADIHHNSLIDCGGPAPSEGTWLIYGSGTRVHAHHNYGAATSNLLGAGGYRITSGGSLFEWNYAEDLPNSSFSAFSLALDGTCFDDGSGDCSSESIFRHNIVKTDAADRHLQCIRLSSTTHLTITAENNTCYGQASAVFMNGAANTTATIRNNLFLNIGGSGTRDVIDRLNNNGTWNIDYNLFDWATPVDDFITSGTPTDYATIAAACAALGYVGCNNKGGQGLTDSLIVHDTTRFSPAGLHSGVLGFQTMPEGEINHRTGWGFDTANAEPSGVGMPMIGAVTAWGFPCVGAYELAKTNSNVPTKFCESR